jgi:hypothetical protein
MVGENEPAFGKRAGVAVTAAASIAAIHFITEYTPWFY